MSFHEKTFHYYRYFFNFNYYLFLSPYRVKCVGTGGSSSKRSYVIVDGGFHKLLCILMQIILALASITMLLGTFNISNGDDEASELSISQDPLRLFQLARVAGFPAYVCTLIACIWFQKKHFLHILQLSPPPSTSFESDSTLTRDTIRIAATTTVLCLTAVILAPFYFFGEDVLDNCRLWSMNFGNMSEEQADWYWNPDCFYSYAGTVHHNLFLKTNPEPMTSEEITSGGISLTIIYGILNIYQIIVIHVADTFALVGALAVHSIGKDLARVLTLDVNSEITTQRVMNYYGEVKQLIEHINGGTGPIIVCMFVVTIPYFVENLMVFFDEDDWALKIRFAYYFIHYFSIMVIASEAHHLLNEFKNWILRKICVEKTRGDPTVKMDFDCVCLISGDRGQNGGLAVIPPKGDTKPEFTGVSGHFEESTHWKLAIIYLETSTHNVIGLKGCSFFTITYGFLGSIVSVLLTYFIVMTQFKAPFNSKSSFRKPDWLKPGGSNNAGTFVNPSVT